MQYRQQEDYSQQQRNDEPRVIALAAASTRPDFWYWASMGISLIAYGCLVYAIS